MRWNMRMRAAERGIWKSTELRRTLAEAGPRSAPGRCLPYGPGPRPQFASTTST